MTNHSPQIMGILNVTPDSFSDGGEYLSPLKAVDKALAMVDEGAHIIDVGGQSTRPGASPISAKVEIDRIIPVIQKICQLSSIPISIDTTKSDVAQRALEVGATLINDVSGLREDPLLIQVAQKYQVPLIIMHSRGCPQTMRQLTNYGDLLLDVINELTSSVTKALEGGILKKNIYIDPGFGFAKTTEQNIFLLKNLHQFKQLNYPVVVGVSRKSFIGQLTGKTDPHERDLGSALAGLIAVLKGATILRVHNVALTQEVLNKEFLNMFMLP